MGVKIRYAFVLALLVACSEPSNTKKEANASVEQLIKVLVNGVKESGEHTVNADVSAFAKGIYFYKMQAKDFSATRKLIIQ